MPDTIWLHRQPDGSYIDWGRHGHGKHKGALRTLQQHLRASSALVKQLLTEEKPEQPTGLPQHSNLHVEKYGDRNFAVYDGDRLEAVTLYRKGAENVKHIIETKDAEIERLKGERQQAERVA